MQPYRASSLFQPANLVRAIKQTMNPLTGPSYLYGSALAFPCTIEALTIAVMGMDFVMVDALHSEGNTVAVVRVPSLHSYLLTYALDAGAAGIVFPHIDTQQEAAEAVSKCRYASSGGSRSLAPCALVRGVADTAPPGLSHAQVADAHVAVICQIESSLALENADAIAAIPGVSCLMLGPGDLRLSLGLPIHNTGEFKDPKFLAAVDGLVTVSRRHRKALITVSFKVSVWRDTWIRDFNLVLVTADFFNVVNGHREDLKRAKDMMDVKSDVD